MATIEGLNFPPSSRIDQTKTSTGNVQGWRRGQSPTLATNFFTDINSFNQRSQLAQRGHSKEGRRSLRIIGVALLVTADFRLPLLHRTYPGNRPDAPTFQSLAADLARRYREIAAGTETVTLVFDKGNNSRPNLDWVERIRRRGQSPSRAVSQKGEGDSHLLSPCPTCPRRSGCARSSTRR